jgi:hypothetical protein
MKTRGVTLCLLSSSLTLGLQVKVGVDWGLSREQLLPFYQLEYAYEHSQHAAWQFLVNDSLPEDALFKLISESNHYAARAKLYQTLQPKRPPAECSDFFFTVDSVELWCGVGFDGSKEPSILSVDKIFGAKPALIVYFNLQSREGRSKLSGLEKLNFILRPTFYAKDSDNTWLDLSAAAMTEFGVRSTEYAGKQNDSAEEEIELPPELAHLDASAVVLEKFKAASDGQSMHQLSLKLTQAVVSVRPSLRSDTLRAILENYPVLHQALNKLELGPQVKQLALELNKRLPERHNYVQINGVDFDANCVDLHKLIEVAVASKTGKLTDDKKELLARTLTVSSYSQGKGGLQELACPVDFLVPLGPVEDDHQSRPLHVNAILNPGSQTFPKTYLLLWKLSSLRLLSGSVCLNPSPRMGEYPFKSFHAVDGRPPRLIPPTALLTVHPSVPQSWLIVVDERTPIEVDVDNVLLDGVVNATTIYYRLKHMVWEAQLLAYNSTDKSHFSPTGARLVLSRGLAGGVEEETSALEEEASALEDETSVLAGGYFQAKVQPGLHTIKALGRRHPILADSLSLVPFQIVIPAAQAFMVGEEPTREDRATVNVLMVTSGKPYERLSLIMMLSGCRHFLGNGDRMLKFWLLDQFVSPAYRLDLQKLSAILRFEYEFVSYKLPSWMYPQRAHSSLAMAYKVLFLDVLLPRCVPRVIVQDADQIIRVNLAELADLDLDNKVYGLTPFCSDKLEAERFAYWRHPGSYWHRFLKGRSYFQR